VLRLSPPPLEPGPDAVTGHIGLDPVPASVGMARSFLRETLGDADDLDTALLLTSELVTNAILHARTPVQLGVVVEGITALVCVADRMTGGAVVKPRSHSHHRPGGRGLALVADLSDAWGTESYSDGKTVWFTVPVSDRALRAG
jgi:anti-sigma regulatory factor (Ser/Thr protein kinase)